MPIEILGMHGNHDVVWVALTREEAWEVLVRCLSSDEEDNHATSSALKKLARAIESRHEPIARCAA